MVTLEEPILKTCDNTTKSLYDQYKWLGVDLDGTLVESPNTDEPYDPSKIGKPIMRMVEKVRAELTKGRRIKIFTARADTDTCKETVEMVTAIDDFCMMYFGMYFPITNEKDRYCEEIWDDRAKGVIKNMGYFDAEEVFPKLG